MKFIKKAIALMALAASTFLAGCGGSNPEPTFTTAQMTQASNKAATEAAARAKAEEAAKADAKLVAARNEMSQFGKDIARKGSYLLTKNCEVKPDGFAKTNAATDFPSTAFGMYRDACAREVVAMKAERDQGKWQAVADAKAKERKLAAAKLQANKQRLAAAKQKQGPVKPAAYKRQG